MHRLVKFIIFVGLMWMYGLSSILINTFLVAFENENKSVIISVNDYGEAYLEYALFYIVYPIITIAIFYVLELINNRSGKNDNTELLSKR